jgi:hypothetical protein
MRVRDFEVRNRLRLHSAAQNIWKMQREALGLSPPTRIDHRGRRGEI